MSEPQSTSLLSSLGDKLLDAKDAVVTATTGVEPVNRNAPAPPQAPAVDPAVQPIGEGQDLAARVASANQQLENKPTYYPPAKPHQQLMMDKLHNLGVRELGRDLFYYRQFFTEDEISEYWKEFEPTTDHRATVGELNHVGGRRPAFAEVRNALAGRPTDQTLSFAQFLGLLKEARGLDQNRQHLLHREKVILDGTHGNSEEERKVLMHFVNILLERDDTVQGILPLDDQSPLVFQEFADGGLFCKLINRIKPGTIQEDKFHFGEGLHFLELMDNHVISLKAARSLGANVDTVDPKGLITGDARNVLAYLEQLFRLTFGCGSRAYNEEEHDRQAHALGAGLVGKPAEPGYFVPADSNQSRDVSEAALTAAEHSAPSEQGLHLLEAELQAARAAAQRAQDHVIALEKSYQQALSAQQAQVQAQPVQTTATPTPTPNLTSSFSASPANVYNSPALVAARSAPLSEVLGTLSPMSTRAYHPAPAFLSSSMSRPAPGTIETVVEKTVVPSTTTSVLAPTTPAAAPTAAAPVATATAAAPKRAGEALVKGILRWKKRYIALDNNWLHIYKNSGISTTGKHSINLVGATVTRDIEASKDHAIFVNNTTQGEKAHLSFNNSTYMQDWLKDLSEAQAYFAANPSAVQNTLPGTKSVGSYPIPSKAAQNSSSVYNPATTSQGTYPTTTSQGSYPAAYQPHVTANPVQTQPLGQSGNIPQVPIKTIRPAGYQPQSRSMYGSAPVYQHAAPNYFGMQGQGQPAYGQTQAAYGAGQTANTTTIVGSSQGGFTRVSYSNEPMGQPKLDFSDPTTLREFGLQHLVQQPR